jgi:hypothetical protein
MWRKTRKLETYIRNHANEFDVSEPSTSRWEDLLKRLEAQLPGTGSKAVAGVDASEAGEISTGLSSSIGQLMANRGLNTRETFIPDYFI